MELKLVANHLFTLSFFKLIDKETTRLSWALRRIVVILRGFPTRLIS